MKREVFNPRTAINAVNAENEKLDCARDEVPETRLISANWLPKSRDRNAPVRVANTKSSEKAQKITTLKTLK